MKKIILITMLLCLTVITYANPPEWSEPFPPFHIAGNLYYVGSKDLASYLITTPQGNILINSSYDVNVPLIKASIKKLGFNYSDIKILLTNQAHADHASASALIKKETGAKYMVMDGDVSVVQSGGKTDFLFGNDPAMLYPPATLDRVLHDQDEVKLGDTTLIAHLTPGHTKGCTTWTMKVNEQGKLLNVVIVGGVSINPGTKLVNNTAYPTITRDYEKMWQVLKSLPCDIFLGGHGGYFNLIEKYARMKNSTNNPFIDSEGYKKFIAQKEQDYKKLLKQQQNSNLHQ